MMQVASYFKAGTLGGFGLQILIFSGRCVPSRVGPRGGLRWRSGHFGAGIESIRIAKEPKDYNATLVRNMMKYFCVSDILEEQEARLGQNIKDTIENHLGIRGNVVTTIGETLHVA